MLEARCLRVAGARGLKPAAFPMTQPLLGVAASALAIALSLAYLRAFDFADVHRLGGVLHARADSRRRWSSSCWFLARSSAAFASPGGVWRWC